MEKFGNQFVVYPYRLTKKSKTRIDEYEQVVGDTTVIIGVTAKYASGIENNLNEKGFTKIIKLPDGEGN